MGSYTFFKVRDVVATKGNTTSRHFTTPHTSYFTENINKERNESPCLTSLPTFGPGSSGSVTRENFPALSGRIKFGGFKQKQKFLRYFTQKEMKILLS